MPAESRAPCHLGKVLAGPMIASTLPLLLTLVQIGAAAGAAPAPILEEIKILDLTGARRQIGSSYENRFGAPSREEAIDRRDDLKSAEVPTKLEDFLGQDIDRVEVTFIDPGLTWAEAESQVRAALESNVVWPDVMGGEPELTCNWAEDTPAVISTRVCFRQPERSVLSGCGVLELYSSNHMFFQDSWGISWWYRTPPAIVIHAERD
jgi:hypothetical protein